MKLFFFPIAPNPTKVRLYLAEKRAAGRPIEVEEVLVDFFKGEQNEPAHLARSPFGTLPVLETDEGQNLFESLAIIEYLEELHPEPSLYGDTPEARAEARQLERGVDLGVLGAIARIIHATKSPFDRPPNPELAAAFAAQLPRRLDHLEGLLSDGRPFLIGDRVTVADCTLAAALQFARFREMEFIEDHPGIQRWDAEYRKRPAALAVLNV